MKKITYFLIIFFATFSFQAYCGWYGDPNNGSVGDWMNSGSSKEMFRNTAITDFFGGSANHSNGSVRDWSNKTGLTNFFGSSEDKYNSPYLHRISPEKGEVGRPSSDWSIDTQQFTSGTRVGTKKNWGIRNKDQFWAEWSKQHPEMLSDRNKSIINNGYAPKVDDVWLQYFPEQKAYKYNTLEHHHVNRGRYAIPLPKKAHRGYPMHYPWQ